MGILHRSKKSVLISGIPFLYQNRYFSPFSFFYWTRGVAWYKSGNRFCHPRVSQTWKVYTIDGTMDVLKVQTRLLGDKQHKTSHLLSFWKRRYIKSYTLIYMLRLISKITTGSGLLHHTKRPVLSGIPFLCQNHNSSLRSRFFMDTWYTVRRMV